MIFRIQERERERERERDVYLFVPQNNYYGGFIVGKKNTFAEHE